MGLCSLPTYRTSPIFTCPATTETLQMLPVFVIQDGAAQRQKRLLAKTLRHYNFATFKWMALTWRLARGKIFLTDILGGKREQLLEKCLKRVRDGLVLWLWCHLSYTVWWYFLVFTIGLWAFLKWKWKWKWKGKGI